MCFCQSFLEEKRKFFKKYSHRPLFSVFLAGLLILSSIISIFVPVFRLTAPDYAPSYSETFAPFSTLIDTVKYFIGLNSDTEIEKQFVANGGKGLLEKESEDTVHRYHRLSPSLEQVMKDVAFKREYSPSADERGDFFLGYLDIANQNANKIYTDMASLLPSTATEEKRLLREELDKEVLTVAAIAEAYREEVERFNFAGLNCFISSCSTAFSDLTQESVAAFEAQYLIGNYGLEVIQPLLANGLGGISQTMPEFTDSFVLNNDKSGVDFQVGGYVCGGCGIFNIIVIVFAIIQICLAIPVILDLVGLIKNQPRVEKPKTRKEKFLGHFFRKTHSYCSPVIALTMIFFPIVIRTMEDSVGASGICFGLVFAVALNVLAVVSEIVLRLYRKNHPLQ